MRLLPGVAALVLALPSPRPPAAAAPSPTTAAPSPTAALAEELGLDEAEARACASELAVVERRRRLFAAQRLAPAEAARRNADALARVAECRAGLREASAAEAEERAVRAEAARRLPEGAGEVQRREAERQVRVERARARAPAERRPDERRLLAEDDAGRARARAEATRRDDPAARRHALAAQLCVVERDLARTRADRDAEARRGDEGLGDRRRRYFLQAEIRRLETAAQASREELERYGGPLPCGDPRVRAVVRCVDLGRERAAADEACRAEGAASLGTVR